MESLDQNVQLIIEHEFAKTMLNYGHVLHFLNVCAEKGQSFLVEATIKALNNEFYWQIMDKLQTEKIDLTPIRKNVVLKFQELMKSQTQKYRENAIRIKMINL